MTNEIWIITTATEDGAFDIFDFNTWLHESTLETLYLGLTKCEQDELKHVRRICRFNTTDEEREQHKYKARFYAILAREIKREIAHRRYPGLRPVSEN